MSSFNINDEVAKKSIHGLFTPRKATIPQDSGMGRTALQGRILSIISAIFFPYKLTDCLASH